MTSKLIGSTSSRADVNFCLRFSYLMTSSEPAAFSVLRGYAGREEVLMTLSGYHGPDWAGAQVTWASSQNVHVCEAQKFRQLYRAFAICLQESSLLFTSKSYQHAWEHEWSEALFWKGKLSS